MIVGNDKIMNLTLKEWCEVNGWDNPQLKWWMKILAHLHHAISQFRGHRPFNAESLDTAYETPGNGAPRCHCGEIVGKCEHYPLITD